MAHRVVVVDDSRIMRKILRDALVGGGYDVVGEARDGKEAVSLYFQLKPDLVTMDINMPNMTGTEAIREIVVRDASAVIIVVTSLNQQVLKDEVMQLGAKGVIDKPFPARVFLEAVEKILIS